MRYPMAKEGMRLVTHFETHSDKPTTAKRLPLRLVLVVLVALVGPALQEAAELVELVELEE